MELVNLEISWHILQILAKTKMHSKFFFLVEWKQMVCWMRQMLAHSMASKRIFCIATHVMKYLRQPRQSNLRQAMSGIFWHMTISATQFVKILFFFRNGILLQTRSKQNFLWWCNLILIEYVKRGLLIIYVLFCRWYLNFTYSYSKKQFVKTSFFCLP